jgi:hypothetical protein
MSKRKRLVLLVFLLLVLLLTTSCGGNPTPPASSPATTHYLYEFVPVAATQGGSTLYRVVDTDARVVCYVYTGTTNMECLPFPDGAFKGDGPQ